MKSKLSSSLDEVIQNTLYEKSAVEAGLPEEVNTYANIHGLNMRNFSAGFMLFRKKLDLEKDWNLNENGEPVRAQLDKGFYMGIMAAYLMDSIQIIDEDSPFIATSYTMDSLIEKVKVASKIKKMLLAQQLKGTLIEREVLNMATCLLNGGRAPEINDEYNDMEKTIEGRLVNFWPPSSSGPVAMRIKDLPKGLDDQAQTLLNDLLRRYAPVDFAERKVFVEPSFKFGELNDERTSFDLYSRADLLLEVLEKNEDKTVPIEIAVVQNDLQEKVGNTQVIMPDSDEKESPQLSNKAQYELITNVIRDVADLRVKFGDIGKVKKLIDLLVDIERECINRQFIGGEKMTDVMLMMLLERARNIVGQLTPSVLIKKDTFRKKVEKIEESLGRVIEALNQ